MISDIVVDSISFNNQEPPLKQLFSNLQTIQFGTGPIEITNSNWVRPITLLPACAMAHRQGRPLKLGKGNRPDLTNYLEVIGFPSGSDTVKIMGTRTYLPLSHISLPSGINLLDGATSEYAKLILETFKKTARTDLSSAFNYVFAEMTTNVVEHAEASNYWLFAQKWKGSPETLEFCIVDDGVGMLKKFESAGRVFTNDHEAIEHALKGHSVKYEGSGLKGDRGHGLQTTARLLSSPELKGWLMVISGMGGAVCKHSPVRTVTSFETAVSWPGVIIGGRLLIPEAKLEIYRYID